MRKINYHHPTADLRDKVAEDNQGIFPNYFERRLVIERNQFIIVPNGGTGDCLFKAIAQAISEEDDETKHLEIRCQIVEYIVQNIWEKLRDSIEIQHVTGNADLISEWINDPIKTYRAYMTTPGNLGSFIELMAAAELLQFNFASIQEYSMDVKTYRVENFSSRNFLHRPIFHFLFTGDYESGHWEHLVPLRPIVHASEGLVDGTYSGSLYIVIDGVQTSLDDWMSEMEERNRKFRHKDEEGSSSKTTSGSESGSELDDERTDQDEGNTTTNAEVDTNSGGRTTTTATDESDTNYDSSVQNSFEHDQGTTTDEDEEDDESSNDQNAQNNLIKTQFRTNFPSTPTPTQSTTINAKSGKKSHKFLVRRASERDKTLIKMSTSPKHHHHHEINVKKKGCFRSIVSYVSSILR